MKPTIILLHGALGSGEQLNSLQDALRAQFKVVNHTLHGHHRDNLAPFTMSELGEEVIQLANQHPWCWIFGYSMGGYAAIKAACKSNKIKGIICLGTKFNWSKESTAKEKAMLQPDQIMAKVPALAEQLEQRFGPGWTELVEHTARMMQTLCDKDQLQVKEIQNIECPVLVLRGEFDKMVSEEESRVMTDILPRGKFETLTEVNHPIDSADAQELTELITEFIELHSEPSAH